ncbi:MAG: MFS transporter [Candidatus Omnitrophota bacterium]
MEQPLKPQNANQKMFEGVTLYHWIIVLIASCGWLFDCMDQRIFVLAREMALTELFDAGTARDIVNFYGTVATTCLMLGWATGGIIFGIFSDKFGRVKTMVLTLLVYSGFTGLSALSIGWIDFCIYRFLVGLGVGGMFGAATTLIAESVPSKVRSLALGSLQSLSATGNIIGSFVALKIDPGLPFSFFGWEMSGWRAVFLVGILPALLVIPIVTILREPEAWKKAKEEAARLRASGETAKAADKEMGSFVDLFKKNPWRRNTIVGLCLGVSGMIGLWGIGFFSPELITTALRDKPLTEEDIKDPGTLALKFKEEKEPMVRYLKQRFSEESLRQIGAYGENYWKLKPEDVKDWKGLCRALKRGERTSSSSPARRAWERMSPEARQAVAEAARGGEADQAAIIEALNGVLAKLDFYAQEDFKSVETPAAAKTIIDREEEKGAESKRTSADNLMLNRLLLDAAYPDLLVDARLPLQVLFDTELNRHLETNLFYEFGYADLFVKMKEGKEPIYVYMKSQLPAETQTLIETYDFSQAPTAEQQRLLAQSLIELDKTADKIAADNRFAAYLGLSKGVRNLIEKEKLAKEGKEKKENIIVANRALYEAAFPGEIRMVKEYAGQVRAKGTMLQDVGSFLGMFAFTLVATFMGRRLAFFISFILCMFITMFVFNSLNSAWDAYWMLPLMGFAQLSLFGGYSIYFPELYPTRLRGTGVGFCYNTVRYLAAPFPILLGYLAMILSFRTAAILMSTIYVIGMVALIWAPETKGQELPED